MKNSAFAGKTELHLRLEALYGHYNRRRFVHPDPLEFLYGYPDLRDREIVGLIAAALAYGRVGQILKSVSRVLTVLGPSPFRLLMETPDTSVEKLLDGFVHRFARGCHLSKLLAGMKGCIEVYGSLHRCFLADLNPRDQTIDHALKKFVEKIRTAGGCPGHLLPDPKKGSACKRLHLYLRWMVRQDEVDPGGWEGVAPRQLSVPVDVHMHRMGIGLGFTSRKQADCRTAAEITDGFRQLVAEDPVKYDFVLTRFGIWKTAEGRQEAEGGGH